MTLYGTGFGSSQGSSKVTLGGVEVAAYKIWGTPWLWYQKITVQLGPNVPSGTSNLVVTTSQGSSNPMSFTVRSGRIFCVSTSGNDGNTGQFPSQCWATLLHARSSMSAGDITYAEDGVRQTTVDPASTSFGKPEDYSAFLMNTGGSLGSPLAIVAYPGAGVTIGTTSIASALEVPNISGNFDHWIIAGITIRGQAGIVMSSSDMRFVGNDISCSGESSWGCVEPGGNNYVFYGNDIHDVGQNCAQNPNTCKLYHAIYFGVSNHDQLGWNIIDPDPLHTGVAGCRAIQFHTTDGSGLDDSDLHIHDNIIRDTICDALNLVTVNPDQGTVEIYNNVIHHAGTGPAPSGVESNYACINLDSNETPASNVEVYNNTLYDCGSRGGGSAGAISTAVKARLRNNIIQQLSTETYFTSQGCSSVNGSNNLWYGAGSPSCSGLSANLNVNPLFVGLSSQNFHLQSSSPAINAGITTGAGFDMDGISRPQGGAFDLGVFEFH